MGVELGDDVCGQGSARFVFGDVAFPLTAADGEGRVVESVISPKGKWAAVSTKKRGDALWRLRVVSLASGKIVRDEGDQAGHALRAISDSGLLVESGARGAYVLDVPNSSVKALPPNVDIGYRGFFKSETELVYEVDGSVATLDLSAL